MFAFAPSSSPKDVKESTLEIAALVSVIESLTSQNQELVRRNQHLESQVSYWMHRYTRSLRLVARLAGNPVDVEDELEAVEGEKGDSP